MKNKKTTLITGGAGRIGLSLAIQLVNNKENVLIGDLNKKKLNKIKKTINSKHLEVFSGDLTKIRNIDKLIKFGISKFGLINSAVHCLYPTSRGWGTKFENLK